MSEVNGVVEKISASEINTKFGPKNKVAFLVNGDWYGSILNKNNEEAIGLVKENDIVKIEYTKNGTFKNLESVEVIAENVPEVEKVIEKKHGTAVTKEVVESVQKLNDKDLRITYNGSLKSAIAFVAFAYDKELLALPTKKADKLDVLYEYVKEFTNRFVTDTFTAQLNLNKEETETAPDAEETSDKE